MTEQENHTKGLKLYSQKAIGLATFIGSPLAGAYLIRENYLSLNKPDEAKKSLIIGIISTLILFSGIFLIPESIIDKFPNQILPAIYTGLIYLIVEKIHGSILKQHEENKNEFHSKWKAARIGLISLVIIAIGILGITILASESDEYDAIIEQFTENETETLIFYDHMNTETNSSLLHELETIAIPKWKENIALIQKSNYIKNLPNELLEQNKTLRKYSLLRLKAFELFQKSIKENSIFYDNELEQIHKEIDAQLIKLDQ